MFLIGGHSFWGSEVLLDRLAVRWDKDDCRLVGRYVTEHITLVEKNLR
jgi:hypothetical protein